MSNSYEVAPKTMLFPKWTGIEWEDDVDKAVRLKKTDIDRQQEIYQASKFSWNGHLFHADIFYMLGVRLVCIGYSSDDPLPLPGLMEGKWKTADVDTSGNPILVSMTVKDFGLLFNHGFQRIARSWIVEAQHKAAVEALAKSGATSSEIMEYNHLTGWDY